MCDSPRPMSSLDETLYNLKRTIKSINMANHIGNMMYSDDSSTLTKGQNLYSTSNETDEDLKEINSDAESLCIDKTQANEQTNWDDNDISKYCHKSNNNNIKAEIKRSAEIFIKNLIQMQMNDDEANISQFLNGKCKDGEIANKIEDIYVRTFGNLAQKLEERIETDFREESCKSGNNDADNQMETNHAHETKGSKQILENSQENLDKLTIKLPMEQPHISKKRNIDSVNDITPLNLVVQKKAKFGDFFIPNHDQRDKTESLDHSGNETSTMPIQAMHADMDTASKYATTVSQSNPNVRSIPITSTSTDKITPSADISSANNIIQKHNDETNEKKTSKMQTAPITLADYILSEFGVFAPRKDTNCDKNKESSKIDSIKTTRDENDDIEGQMKNSPSNIKPPTTSPGKTIEAKNTSESVHAPSNDAAFQEPSDNSNGNDNTMNTKLPVDNNPIYALRKDITSESKQLIKEFCKLVEDTIARQEQIDHFPKSSDSENLLEDSENIDENLFMKDTSVTQDKHGKILYNCTRCNVSFPHLTDLQMHTFTHYRKRHWCPACSKEFQNLNGVKRHMIIHTRLKPFSCPKCDRAFNLSKNLRKHCQRMHDSNLPITTTIENNDNNKQENRDNQNQWQKQNKIVDSSNNLPEQVLPIVQTSQQNTCVPSTQANGEHFLTQPPTQILQCSSIETRDQHLSHISPIKVVTSPNAGVPPGQTTHHQASGANDTTNDIKQLGPTAMLKFHLPSLKSLQSKITERVNKLEEKFRRIQAMIPNVDVKQISPSSLYPSESLPPWKSLDYVPSMTKGGADCLQSGDFRQNCGNPLQANHGYPDTIHINGQCQTQQIPMPRIHSTVLNSPPRSEQQSQAQMNIPMPGAYDQTGTYYRYPNNQLQNVPQNMNQAMGTTQGGPVIIARPQVSTNYNVERSGEITTSNLCPNVPLPVNKSNSHQIQLGQTLDQIKCDPRSVDDIWKFFALIHKEKQKVAQFPPQLPSSILQPPLSFSPSIHVPSRQTGYIETPRSVFDVQKISETPLEFVQNDTRTVPLDLSVKCFTSHVNQF